MWIGWYCDTCLDWIDANEDAQMREYLFQRAQEQLADLTRVLCATTECGLLRVFRTDGVADLIAELIASQWIPRP